MTTHGHRLIGDIIYGSTIEQVLPPIRRAAAGGAGDRRVSGERFDFFAGVRLGRGAEAQVDGLLWQGSDFLNPRLTLEVSMEDS